MKIKVDCCDHGPAEEMEITSVKPELARMLKQIHEAYPRAGRLIRLNMETTTLCGGCEQKLYGKFKELKGRRLMTKPQLAYAQGASPAVIAKYTEFEEKRGLNEIPTLLEMIPSHG
jgi:hypothetical protein